MEHMRKCGGCAGVGKCWGRCVKVCSSVGIPVSVEKSGEVEALFELSRILYSITGEYITSTSTARGASELLVSG